jgi:hypothetical protein
MKPYKDIEVGDLAVIPKGTEFWSIALQEEIIPTRDIVIKITNTCYGNEGYVFGNIQLVFKNLALAQYIGLEKARGYMDQAHGDIGIGYDKLKDYIID